MQTLDQSQVLGVSGGNPVAVALAVVTVIDWAIDFVRGFQEGSK